MGAVRLAVTAGVVLSLALATNASAITRGRADAIALQKLGTGDLAGMVALFGEPSPLPAGDVVGAWSLSTRSRSMPSVRLRHRAWLFWEDLIYGAGLAHPSQMLLVDDASGRVLAHIDLNMMPLVNGAEPPFAPGKPGYTSRRYVVYSTVSLSGGARDAAAAADPATPFPVARAAQAAPITVDDLKGQCLITFGDRGKGPGNSEGDNLFTNDFSAIGGWARSVKLLSDKAGSTVADLKASIYKLMTDEKNPCRDFMIFIAGHGRVPNPNQVGDVKVHYGPFAPPESGPGSNEPGIQLTANRPTGSAPDAAPQSTFVTPADISAVITSFSEPGAVTFNHETHKLTAEQVKGVKFKLKLQSCFTGWFAKVLLELRHIPPGQAKPDALALVETSSSATEPSFYHLSSAPVLVNGQTVMKDNPNTNTRSPSEATNANVYGLMAWVKDPTMGRTLEAGIQQAFTSGATHDFARTIGYTHPQVLGPGINLGTPDPATSSTTFVTQVTPGGQGGTPPPGGSGTPPPGGGGNPPNTSSFCNNVPPGSYCDAWLGGQDPSTETTLLINNQADIAHFNFALPSGTTVTSVSGGCTFSANDISCPNPVPVGQKVTFDITTQQALQANDTAMLTTYDSQGNATPSSVQLQTSP